MKPVKYQLKNGLTVLLAESRKSPVLSVQMWVRTGSADESPAQAGISHFIEHLVFKGTRKFGVGEIAATVEGAGGELNAYTSFDQTVFHVTIASAEADTALEVISEMMGHPKFDPTEIDREREVVIEEIKRGQDSPGRRNSELLFGSSYVKHPYGRPVIGYEKVVKNVSVGTLKKYYKDRYSPRNMFLLVAGDFTRPEMKAKVENFFGDFADNKIRIVKRPKEASPKARIKVAKAPFHETHVNLAWRIPPVKHKDVPGLDALGLILGQGDSSRLARRLRIDQAIVQGVGSSAFTPLDEGIFTVSLSIEADRLDSALAITAEELNKFMLEGPTPEEIAKASVSLASDTIYSLESVDGLARSYGGMEFYLRDPLAYAKYLKQLSKLTPADLVALARKYLKPERLVASAMTDGDPAKFQKALKTFTKAYYPAKKAKPAKKGKIKKIVFKTGSLGASASTPVEKVELPGGGLLLLKKQSETPTVSFRMAFGGGLALESHHQEGLNELFSRTWAAGGRKFDEVTLNAKIDSLAAGLGTFSGRNSVGLNADFISNFDKPMWEIIQDCLQGPSLPESVFERERSLLARQIHLRKDHPSYVCMRGFTEALFKGHPYAKDTQGTEESLPKLKLEDLQQFWTKNYLQGNFAVAVVGDIDSKLWKARLTELALKIPKGPSQIKEIKHNAPEKDVRVFKKMNKEQAHLVIGMRGLGIRDPRRWALQIMQAVLAGQGGRLFLELRDKKSLAYSVSPIEMEGLGTGSFGAYIGCSPEKVEIAERMIHEEFQKLVSTKISEEELLRAQRYLSGRTVIDLQRKSTISSSILFDELYGNSAEEGLKPQERYFAVTREEVMSLAKDLFSRPTVRSLVSPIES